MRIFAKKEKNNRLFMCGVAITLIVCFAVFVISPVDFVNAEEIQESYLYQNQWYAGEAFLDYASTMALIQSQKITENKEKYMQNPIIIAVIDTGVDYGLINPENPATPENKITHPVFNNLIYENKSEINGLPNYDDDKNGYIDDVYGWNFVNNNNCNIDTCIKNDSHGTHVSGIVAQQLIAYGLTDYFKILPVKAGGDSSNGEGASFNVDNTINAIDYAIEAGAKIINMSLGAYESAKFGTSTGWGKDSRIDNAIRRAYENDVIVVAAAGNDGHYAYNSKTTFYPAAFDTVYGVMAYDKSNSVAKFNNGSSNTGDCYNFIAPGKDIYSTMRNGRYGEKSGTSMACPMVTAMVGVLMLKYDCDTATVREVLNNYDAKTLGTTKYRKASLLDMLSYIPIEQIQIECSSDNLSQKLDNISKITCKASVYTRYKDQSEAVLEPDTSEIYDTVKWFICKDDKTIATRLGQYLNYIPSEAGNYDIFATTEHSTTQSNKILFEINYVPLAEVNFSPSGISGNIYKGQPYVYKMSGYEYIDPAEMPLFNWYLNDALVTTTQSYEFCFVPTDLGKYEITCKLADSNKMLARYEVKVKNDFRSQMILSFQIIITIITIIVYCLILYTVIKEVKIKCPKKNKI